MDESKSYTSMEKAAADFFHRDKGRHDNPGSRDDLYREAHERIGDGKRSKAEERSQRRKQAKGAIAVQPSDSEEGQQDASQQHVDKEARIEQSLDEVFVFRQGEDKKARKQRLLEMAQAYGIPVPKRLNEDKLREQIRQALLTSEQKLNPLEVFKEVLKELPREEVEEIEPELSSSKKPELHGKTITRFWNTIRTPNPNVNDLQRLSAINTLLSQYKLLADMGISEDRRVKYRGYIQELEGYQKHYEGRALQDKIQEIERLILVHRDLLNGASKSGDNTEEEKQRGILISLAEAESKLNLIKLARARSQASEVNLENEQLNLAETAITLAQDPKALDEAEAKLTDVVQAKGENFLKKFGTQLAELRRQIRQKRESFGARPQARAKGISALADSPPADRVFGIKADQGEPVSKWTSGPPPRPGEKFDLERIRSGTAAPAPEPAAEAAQIEADNRTEEIKRYYERFPKITQSIENSSSLDELTAVENLLANMRGKAEAKFGDLYAAKAEGLMSLGSVFDEFKRSIEQKKRSFESSRQVTSGAEQTVEESKEAQAREMAEDDWLEAEKGLIGPDFTEDDLEDLRKTRRHQRKREEFIKEATADYLKEL
ncbi:MAG: hypothetical protein HY395_01450 [Candidatus Doudnabacteria bacterium]|nr:hypothetical protein [Candidatus Doudnabacteria bacterium]